MVCVKNWDKTQISQISTAVSHGNNEAEMNLFDVCEKCNRQVEKMVLAFYTQQKAVHAFFELASFAEYLLWVTLSSLCQFIGSYQQLLCISDCILTHTMMQITIRYTQY